MDQNNNGRPPMPFSNGGWDQTSHADYQNHADGTVHPTDGAASPADNVVHPADDTSYATDGGVAPATGEGCDPTIGASPHLSLP